MEKEKIRLAKAIAQSLEYTKSIPYYQEDTINRMMAIQKSEKRKWIDGSHMLNELSVQDLYRALTEGYELET